MIPFFEGIRFVTAGEVENCSGHTSKMFDGYWGIQYNHSGPMTIRIDRGCEIRIEGPHVFLTVPGHHFDYGAPPGESRHHVFCCFRGPRVEEFLRRGLLVPKDDLSPIGITRPEAFLSGMRSLLAILHRPGLSSESAPPRAVLLLEDLLLQIQEQPELPHADSHFCHALEELAESIRRNPNLEWDLKKEADSIGISVPYLRKLFTMSFHCPPHKFILECRLQLASDMLLHRQIPIAEVALRAGFEDPYYFSRIFKKRKGLSPFRYRSSFAL